MSLPTPILVISGLPGSGKSSTARAIAARLPQSAHIEADVLHNMITQGRARPDDAFYQELSMCPEWACQLARSFVDRASRPSWTISRPAIGPRS